MRRPLDLAAVHSRCTTLRRLLSTAQCQRYNQARCNILQKFRLKMRRDNSSSNTIHRMARTSCMTWLRRCNGQANQCRHNMSTFRSIGSAQALHLRHLLNSEFHRALNTTLLQVNKVRLVRQHPSFRLIKYPRNINTPLTRNLALQRRKHIQVP